MISKALVHEGSASDCSLTVSFVVHPKGLAISLMKPADYA